MALKFGGRTRWLGRIAALALVSGATAACSSVPDWVDPTTWIGGGDKSAADQPNDTSSTPTPDIAGIPNKPTPPSSSDEQKQVADALEADRASAKYSGEALRGGTEPAAAPPSAAPPPEEPAPPVVNPEPGSSTSESDASTSGSDNLQASSASAPGANPGPAPATRSAGTDAAATSSPATSAATASQQTAMLTPPSAASPSASAQPAAVVLFPNDAVVLNAAAKAQIRNTAQAFQTHGGQGFVRVVGHSSSRTPDMPLERHLQVVFERSQERATAVARELIKDGVPAEKVLIEAVGDSQPMYYESMPQGEEGNRRAEIFLQS